MRALIVALMLWGAFCVYSVVSDNVQSDAQTGTAFRAEAVPVFSQLTPPCTPDTTRPCLPFGEGGTPIEPPEWVNPPRCTPDGLCIPGGEGGTPIELPPHNGD